MNNPKRLVIIGAGGFGREIASWRLTAPKLFKKLAITEIVFVDDNHEAEAPYRVVASIIEYIPDRSDLVVCAIGDPALRRIISAQMQTRGAYMPSFVHDSVIIGERVSLSEGTIICPQVTLTADVEIGVGSHINVGCVVGHDVRVGAYVTVSPACVLTGGVTVRDGAFLGAGVMVAPKKTIGENAKVGIGSTVVRQVKPGTTVFGVPARAI
ncbi:acetyltransferase [Glutamicibacter bergerei]